MQMEDLILKTDRLILRKFEERDMEALFYLLRDEEVNTFLPWFPVKSIEETRKFYEKRFAGRKYYFAICLKEDTPEKRKDIPIGYIKAESGDSYDFGYALRREFWHKGIAAEAGRALIELLRKDGIPYITATHDRNNPRSGKVMRRLGMKYCYSYEEQWQPKDFPVVFRMYQMNFDGQDDRMYRKYWEMYEKHFIEENTAVH